jgi:hypothetical protein
VLGINKAPPVSAAKQMQQVHTTLQKTNGERQKLAGAVKKPLAGADRRMTGEDIDSFNTQDLNLEHQSQGIEGQFQ